MERFELAVRAALETIPAEFQQYLRDVEFVVAERSPGPPRLLGLYHGSGALHPGGLPDRITLYRDTHEEVSRNWFDLVDQVRRTVLHEVGHHFGMGEEELRLHHL